MAIPARAIAKLHLFKTVLYLAILPQLLVVRAIPIFPSGGTEYRIELRADGSAFWKITYSVHLATEEDRTEFRLYAENFTSMQEVYLSDFRDTMRSMVSEISDLTGRSMEVDLFNASIGELLTPAGYLGTLTYSFLWKGFLEDTGSSLYMGDVFEGGFYLYDNETLVLVPPPGYRVDYVCPPPDFSNSILKWYGRRNFGNGEPAAMFVTKSTSLSLSISKDDVFEGDEVVIRGDITPPFVARITLVCQMPDGSVRNQTLLANDKGHFETSLQLSRSGTWSVKAVFVGDEDHLASESPTLNLRVNAKLSALAVLFSLGGVTLIASTVVAVVLRRRKAAPEEPPITSIQDDREKLLSLLRARGGMMYQRDVGRSLGFSKSKTTSLLSALEREGLIVREKRGREKLVRLARSASGGI